MKTQMRRKSTEGEATYKTEKFLSEAANAHTSV